jgi:type III pantothenate kinase
MLLALDVGNTNITLGRLDGGRVVSSRRAATRARATADEVEVLLGELLALDGIDLDDVNEIVLASVVPAVTATLGELCSRRAISVLVADSRTIPLPLRVDRPTEVGADRLVNALAAARLYGAPAIVVDFGTATNFDVVAADGAYVGGALAPGLELGLDALATRTAKLPRIELTRPARAIGTNTVTAMQSGAVIGYIGLVHELLVAIRAELADQGGPPPKVILTGGLTAAPWAAEINGVDAIDPELTLRGLAILHDEVAAATQVAAASEAKTPA